MRVNKIQTRTLSEAIEATAKKVSDNSDIYETSLNVFDDAINQMEKNKKLVIDRMKEKEEEKEELIAKTAIPGLGQKLPKTDALKAMKLVEKVKKFLSTNFKTEAINKKDTGYEIQLTNRSQLAKLVENAKANNVKYTIKKVNENNCKYIFSYNLLNENFFESFGLNKKQKLVEQKMLFEEDEEENEVPSIEEIEIVDDEESSEIDSDKQDEVEVEEESNENDAEINLEEPVEANIVEEPTEENINNGVASAINMHIVDAWTNIDRYNSVIATLLADNVDDEIIQILQGIVEDLMMHVGQLEKALILVSPAAEKVFNNNTDEEESVEDAEVVNNDEEELEISEVEVIDSNNSVEDTDKEDEIEENSKEEE